MYAELTNSRLKYTFRETLREILNKLFSNEFLQNSNFLLIN